MADLPKMSPVKSSNIEAVGYDAGSLHVRFKGGGHYIYAGVPKELHGKLMEADSAGKFIGEHIKGKYDHRKHDPK